MTTPYRIRVAEAGDEDALAVLDRSHWSPLYAVHPRPEPPYPPFFDATHLPAHFLLAEWTGGDQDGSAPASPGALVGYIRMVPRTSLPSNAHVREIQGLLVDPAVRGHGVGRALLEEACARAREEGALRMGLRVLGTNEPARRLYAAAGFAEEGRLPGEFLLAGDYVDDVLMGRWLGP
ncbi:GNAT family N-acetyltransferase [Streptomyces oceani]|uniref:Acetyltransferase n=1 Tax=Streptomyces oceani TaxID=1075402 RepID=A0A1E7KCM9_9ACTN|nr:GNAT family N-acetyltransferase [Streptomyces oceani]OEV01715.1 acetyltransferase [Streptomyces oceani]